MSHACVLIVLEFNAKHKVLNSESFPYILSFSNELWMFSPLNDLMYMVWLLGVVIVNKANCETVHKEQCKTVMDISFVIGVVSKAVLSAKTKCSV